MVGVPQLYLTRDYCELQPNQDIYSSPASMLINHLMSTFINLPVIYVPSSSDETFPRPFELQIQTTTL